MVAGVRLCCVLWSGVVVLAGCGGGSPTKPRPAPLRPSGTGGQLVFVGEPAPARPATVSGSGGTLELRAVEAGRSRRSSLLATLVRPVAREPRDACFGLYTANQDPVEGDVVCGVRRPDRFVNSLGETVIPGLPGNATYLLGQAPADVTQMQLVGPAGNHRLPLSAHRVFLAVLSPSTRGLVEVARIVVELR